jgi:predicted ABC-type ATPase
MSPFAPEAPAVRAGRLVLREIQNVAKHRVSFAFETTLAAFPSISSEWIHEWNIGSVLRNSGAANLCQASDR